MLRSLLLVNEIADQHIQSLVAIDKPSQCGKHFFISVLVHPVVTIYDLIINALGIPESCVDCLAMSAIFLMDGPADARIIFFIFIGNLRGTVLGGTIVHDQDLHFIAAG